MAFTGVLVDRARRLIDTPTPKRVEGTTQFTTTHSAWFKARLTQQQAPESDDAQGGRRRDVRQAQLMVGRKDTQGDLIKIVASDKVEVHSKNLGDAVYLVTGDPEPLRKKRRVLGYTVPLVLVEEHEFDRGPS